MANDSAASNVTVSDQWTVAQIAEDFLAQVEDVFAAGWTLEEAVDTLALQGIDAPTATAICAQVRKQAEDAGRAPAAPPEDSAPLENNAPPLLLDVTASARWIRVPGDSLRIDDSRMDALGSALTSAGLAESTARSFVSELASHERQLLEVYNDRMRRLGLQGMIVGAVFTAFFVWSAVMIGGSGRWHLMTAAATAGLTLYSALLYRHRRPPKLR